MLESRIESHEKHCHTWQVRVEGNLDDFMVGITRLNNRILFTVIGGLVSVVAYMVNTHPPWA